MTSRDNAERLGGSSTDATKNNPINYENIRGKAKVVESGMAILYDMIVTDLQRDLSSSVEARYQPQSMIVQTYESFTRLNKALTKLSINEDRIAENLMPIKNNPGEAMTTILRGERWVHLTYGVGHDFVKKMAIKAQKEKRKLIDVCMEDQEFRTLYETRLDNIRKSILNGELEKYTGSAKERTNTNMEYARETIQRI